MLGPSPRKWGCKPAPAEFTDRTYGHLVTTATASDGASSGVLDLQESAAFLENKLAGREEDHGYELTVAQLAKILQCSKREIYKLIEDKRLPALKVGTIIRFDPETVADWIRGRRIRAARRGAP